MAVSKVQICNLALSHIQFTETTISNLDTDTGKAATHLRIHYDVVRSFVLADHNWNFAGKRIGLAELESPPVVWGYRYDYPSDCLKFREIQRLSKADLPIPYEVEDDGTDGGLCVLTDMENATGIYTRNVTNTALFSPGFVDAFSWRLAAEIAAPLTGDMNVREAAETIYSRKIGTAKAIDGSEGQADPMINSPWERARSAGGE